MDHEVRGNKEKSKSFCFRLLFDPQDAEAGFRRLRILSDVIAVLEGTGKLIR